MKPKILLLSLIILAILIVISFLMSGEGVKNQPLPQTNAIPQQSTIILEPQQLSFPSGHKSIITITKQPPKPKLQELTVKKSAQATTQAEKPIPATASTATAQSVSAPSGNQTEEGIVKIEKRPSKEQMDEMRSHGIILF